MSEQYPTYPGPSGEEPSGYGQQYGGQPGQYPAPSGYGQDPYGSAASGQRPPLASWLQRVGAYFVDFILSALAGIIYLIGYVWLLSSKTTNPDGTTSYNSTAVIVLLIGLIPAIAFAIWNLYIRQGRTGQTLGKQALGIKLLAERDGRPIGGWRCFGRNLLHILDAIPCYIGFLWPLWDRKNQTFADKLMHTVVVQDQSA